MAGEPNVPIAALSAEFDKSLIKKKGKYDYISHALVTERLNDVAPDWSSRLIKEHIYEYNGEPHCAAVTIALTISGVERVETGGPQRRESLALELKNAYSDAIKRAAMRFGVALKIWDSLVDSEHDDDVHPERLDDSPQPATPSPRPIQTAPSALDRLKEVSGAHTLTVRGESKPQQPRRAPQQIQQPAAAATPTPAASPYPDAAPRPCKTADVVAYLRGAGFLAVTDYKSAIKEVNEWVAENWPGQTGIVGTGEYSAEYKKHSIFPSDIYNCAHYYLNPATETAEPNDSPAAKQAVRVAAGGVTVPDDDEEPPF